MEFDALESGHVLRPSWEVGVDVDVSAPYVGAAAAVPVPGGAGDGILGASTLHRKIGV